MGRAGHLDGGERDLRGCHLRRVLLRRHVPARDVRQLRVGLHAARADLAPLQVEAVGATSVAGHRVAADAPLHLGHVVDRHAPGHPATTGLRALPDDLSERGLVGGGVVEDLHDLHVLAVAEREHHVAGAEARVRAAVEERRAESRGELGHGGVEAGGAGGVREVVEVHGPFLPDGPRLPTTGVHQGEVRGRHRGLTCGPPRSRGGRSGRPMRGGPRTGARARRSRPRP